MLSDSDIDKLIESGVLIINLDYSRLHSKILKKCCFEKKLVGSGSDTINKIYYLFAKEETDLWFYNLIGDEIKAIVDSEFEDFKKLVYKKLDRSLPNYESRTETLQFMFLQNVSDLESLEAFLDSWSTYGETRELIRIETDQFLDYDAITCKISFSHYLFDYNFFDKIYPLKISNSIKNEIAGIKHIWLKEQMQNVSDNLNESLAPKVIDNSKSENNSTELSIDSLGFIDKAYSIHFKRVESKVLNGAATFNSDIRCASFCEKLYTEKYIINSKTKIKTLTAFAKARYGKDISKALAASKKAERLRYLNNKVGNFTPLKSAFL